MERRRSSVFPDGAGGGGKVEYDNDAYVDSDFADDTTSGASTFRGSDMGRNSDQFDMYVTSTEM